MLDPIFSRLTCLINPLPTNLLLKRCDARVNRYVDALVVPFGVIVRDVFGYRCPQVSLTERYEAVETLST